MTKRQKLYEGKAIATQIMRWLYKIEQLKLNKKDCKLILWHLKDSQESVEALECAFRITREVSSGKK